MRKNTIVFRVNGNRLERVGGYDPVSGEKNYSVLRFEFDEEWSSAKSVTVTVFKDVKSPFNIVVNKVVGSNMVVANLPAELQGVSGILWVGITGVLTDSDKPTLDTNMVAMPVVQGIRVSEEISTKLYLQIIEYMAKLEAMMIDEENQIKTSYIQNGAVTPEKFDRAYWERGVYISVSPISTFDSLFETVGFLNDGKISYVCVHISVDDSNKRFISGYYFAYGKKSINNTAVYLVDPINSEYWTINYNNDIYEAIETDSFIKRESYTVSTFAELDEIITQDTLTKCVYVFTFPEGSEIFNKTGSMNFVAFGNSYIDTNSGRAWSYAGNGEFYFNELYARIGSINVINDTGHLNVLFDDDIHLINAEIGSAKGIASGHYSGVRYADRDGKGGYVLTNTKTGDVYSYDRDNETFDKLSLTVDDFLSVESENLVKNNVIAKALQNTITVQDMITSVNHELLDKTYNQGYGLVCFDVSDSSGFLPFGRYQALRYHNPTEYDGYLVTNIDTGALYRHSLGSEYCKLLFDPVAIDYDFIDAGSFNTLDELQSYTFEEGKTYKFNIRGELNSSTINDSNFCIGVYGYEIGPGGCLDFINLVNGKCGELGTDMGSYNERGGGTSITIAGSFYDIDDLVQYDFKVGKQYLCYIQGSLSGLIGSSCWFFCTYNSNSNEIYYQGGNNYCSGTISLSTKKVKNTKMMLTKDSVLDNVILADRVTGKNYSLYVADGKLTLEESEV